MGVVGFMKLLPLFRWLLVFIVGGVFAPLAMSKEKPPVAITLSSFIAHGDLDEWGRTVGISCVLTNNSAKAVAAFEGYDGERNNLIGEAHHFPVHLNLWKAAAAKPVTIGPGESKVLYTVSAHAILLLGSADGEREEKWYWGWARMRPRGAPPRSPVHSFQGAGWQAYVAPEVSLTAEVSVEGKMIESEPFVYKLRLPKPTGRALELSITGKDGVPFIKGADFVAYHWPSHAIRLRKGLIEELQEKLGAKLVAGVPFQVRLGGEVLYEGKFTRSLSSHSQSVVVIRLDGPHVTQLELGYPNRRDFKGADPRGDVRVRKALVEAGVLIQ